MAEKGGRLTKVGKWRIKRGTRYQSKRGGESFLGKTSRDQSLVHTVAQYVSVTVSLSILPPPPLTPRVPSPLLSTSKQNTAPVSLCNGYFSPWVPPERYISILYLLIKSLHRCLAPSHWDIHGPQKEKLQLPSPSPSPPHAALFAPKHLNNYLSIALNQ